MISNRITRPKKETFDNLSSGIYLVESGLIVKAGFDEFNNIIGVCIFSKGNYLIIENSEYKSNYRYKALRDSVLLKIPSSEVSIEKLLFEISRLEDLLFIESFKLSLQPLEVSRLIHFANWIGEENLECLTHEEIAGFLGSTRVTIARILSKLYRQGKITKAKGKIDKIVM